MLVLSRDIDRSVMIGDDIEVRVVDIRGDSVRLGIIAPKSISVHRKEVYLQLKREGRPLTGAKITNQTNVRPAKKLETASTGTATEGQRQAPGGITGPQVVHRGGSGSQRQSMRSPRREGLHGKA